MSSTIPSTPSHGFHLLPTGTPSNADLMDVILPYKYTIEREERELQELERKLPTFARAQNSRQPAVRLPTELLEEIFLQYMFGFRPREPPASYALYRDWWKERSDWARSRLKPTQICFHWREVALSCPLLWSSLDTKFCCSTEALTLFLSRSQDIPLDITLDLNTKPPIKHLDWTTLALKEPRRIRMLRLDPNFSSYVLQCIPQASLTQLQHLYVTAEDSGYSRDWMLVAALLRPIPPLLQALTIVNVDVHWRALVDLPTTITSLHIKSCYTSTSNLTDLLDVLQKLSRLEHLHLDGLPKVTGMPERLLHLDSLKKCQIIAPFAPAEYFSQCLSIPFTAQLRAKVTMDEYSTLKGRIRPFVLSMLRCFERRAGKGPGQFTKASVDYIAFGDIVYFECVRNVHTRGERQPDVRLVLYSDDPESRTLEEVNEVLTEMEPPIKVLSCRAYLGLANQELKGLEILEIYKGDSMWSFFFPPNEDGKIPVPTLRELHLTHSPVCVEMVYEGLKKRCEKGYKLPMLRIRCPSSREDSEVRRLRDVVDVLELC